LKFKLGDALVSELIVSQGGSFFSRANGSSPVPVIPGFANPRDTLSTTITERLSSGPFFDRFEWNLVGSYADTTGAVATASKDDLSEETGLGTLGYAISHELSVFATAGYESIKSSVSLTKNLSGAVFLGGFRLNLGPSAQAQFQGGRQYNSTSYTGSLHYELTPTTGFVGNLTDSVTTPAAQLISALTNEVATPTGGYANGGDVFANGNVPTLATFNPTLLNSLSLQQQITRLRAGQIAFYEDWKRTHLAVTVEAESRDILSPLPAGVPHHGNALTGSVTASRDIRRNLKGSLSLSYGTDQEFGGRAGILTTTAALDYQLNEKMSAYLRSSYIDRQPSASLRALSPVTGKLDEARVSIGLRRNF
jgi:uncharacterized protein (PEP-CTERM system associated)